MTDETEKPADKPEPAKKKKAERETLLGTTDSRPVPPPTVPPAEPAPD